MEGQNGTWDDRQQGLSRALGEHTGEANIGSIDAFIEFAASMARNQQFPEERIAEIGRVLGEALANIINFTFDKVPGEIKVSCKIDKFGKFVLAIVDSGKPFNMLLEDDPFIGAMEAANDKPRPTTRTMKRLSSNIEYKRLENKNHLIITLARDMKSGKA